MLLKRLQRLPSALHCMYSHCKTTMWALLREVRAGRNGWWGVGWGGGRSDLPQQSPHSRLLQVAEAGRKVVHLCVFYDLESLLHGQSFSKEDDTFGDISVVRVLCQCCTLSVLMMTSASALDLERYTSTTWQIFSSLPSGYIM